MPFRRFQSRIIVVFMGLFLLVLAAMLAAVDRATTQHARAQIKESLNIDSRVFTRLFDARSERLIEGVRILLGDFALRGAIATRDRDTIFSALENHGARIGANIALLVSLDNVLLVNTLRPQAASEPFPFPRLTEVAALRGEATSIVFFGSHAFQLVVVPVNAPEPIAWVCMGFRVDTRLAQELHKLTSAHVSFLRADADGQWLEIATTLPPPLREDLKQGLPSETIGQDQPLVLDMGGEQYETRTLPLAAEVDTPVVAVLQQSLDEALAPFYHLRYVLVGLTGIGLLVSLAGSVLLARRVTQPVAVLVEGAREIGKGKYDRPVTVKQQDEFGELASTLNHMSRGIAERETRIRYLAYHDEMTGLPNRVSLEEHLQPLAERAGAAADDSRDGGRSGPSWPSRGITPSLEGRGTTTGTWEVGQRTEQLPRAAPGAAADDKVGLLVMALDRFNDINHTLGFQVGDRVLQHVGRRLQELVGADDLVARLDGGQFAIVLHRVRDIEHALEQAHTIQRNLEAPFRIDDQPFEFGTHIGVALYPDHTGNAAGLIRYAEAAMNHAHHLGNSVGVYSTEFDERSQRRLALIGEAREALNTEQFQLYYQPKLDLRRRQVTGVEALVRWQHPQHGFVSPAEFIPVIEQTALIGPFTLAVLNLGIRQAAAWAAAGVDLKVSLNLSARNLLDAQLPEQIDQLLRVWSLPASRIVLEITESALMVNPTASLKVIAQLDALGAGLSIDDYGTGYSSLSFLRGLPLDELKIDRSFVQHMDKDTNDEVIVRSTVDLAHNLGLKVVAEGVETKEVLEKLGTVGCDSIQGYYISKPLATEAFDAWLKQSPYRPVV